MKQGWWRNKDDDEDDDEEVFWKGKEQMHFHKKIGNFEGEYDYSAFRYTTRKVGEGILRKLLGVYYLHTFLGYISTLNIYILIFTWKSWIFSNKLYSDTCLSQKLQSSLLELFLRVLHEVIVIRLSWNPWGK